MTHIIKSRSKIIRRLGILPGLTQKITNEQSKTPGQHGKSTNANKLYSLISEDFKIRLNEKQKLKFNYNIRDKQLFAYYKKAKKAKESTSNLLLNNLEMRFDSIVYRLGFTLTIPEARQLITHGHILLNNKIKTIPSIICKKNDIISISDNILIRTKIILNLNKINNNSICPSYLFIDKIALIGKILNKLNRSELLLDVKDLKVIEYYSK